MTLSLNFPNLYFICLFKFGKFVNNETHCLISIQKLIIYLQSILSQWQILGTGNLPQDSAPVCINIDISPEMAAQSAALKALR